MEKLRKDWITEGLLDFEYKKYILLAYLKHVEQHFDEDKLYPFMTDLIERYEDLQLLKSEKRSIKGEFPKEISRLDLNKLEIIYRKIYEDDELPEEVLELIDYAIPTMENTLGKGKELHDIVTSAIEIDTVGIIPLYKEEGYLFLENGSRQLTEVFQFRMKKFMLHNEQFRGIHFQWLDRLVRGVGDTFEHLKLKMIQTYKALPNPATFVIHSKKALPFEETMVPMSKQLLLQTITKMQ